MKQWVAIRVAAILCFMPFMSVHAGDYVAVDTAPTSGSTFYGQDAQYTNNAPNYTLSGDGLTICDNNTALTPTQGADWTGDDFVGLRRLRRGTELLGFRFSWRTRTRADHPQRPLAGWCVLAQTSEQLPQIT